jgi:Bacterial Ig domain
MCLLLKRPSFSFFLVVFFVSSILSQTENSIFETSEKQSRLVNPSAILSNPTLDKNRNQLLSAPAAVSGVRFRSLRYFTRASNQFPILVEASDTIAISRIEFYVDGILVKTNSLPPNTLNALSYFNWNTIPVANGKHVLQAKSFNTAGNVQTATAVVRSQNFSIPQPVGNVIALNRYVKHQIMEGWEANAETGQLYSAAWNNYKVPLLDQAVNDLGINRIRLEITSGAENPIDYFAQWRV